METGIYALVRGDYASPDVTIGQLQQRLGQHRDYTWLLRAANLRWIIGHCALGIRVVVDLATRDQAISAMRRAGFAVRS